MPASRNHSVKELRSQDHQQNRAADSTFGASPEAPATQTPIVTSLGVATTFQQPAHGSTFGSGGTSAPAASGKQQLPTSFLGGGSALKQPHENASSFGPIGRPNPVLATRGSSSQLDPAKQVYLEEFMRKFFLGEELCNTQFHLFSEKSLSSGRLLKPRVLCTNDMLLAKSSKYFLDLLSSDINPSDRSLADITDGDDVPCNAHINDYGYDSDSDLEDCDDSVPKVRNPVSAIFHPEDNIKTRLEDIIPNNGSEAIFHLASRNSEHKSNEQASVNEDKIKSGMSDRTGIQQSRRGGKMSVNPSMTQAGCLESRHVLVKDTAFQTWYTMLNYISTGKVSFMPLSSVVPGGKPRGSSTPTTTRDAPKCSAKSLYRLACKVGLDHLRKEALEHIQNDLTDYNILQEISSSLVSRHPELLRMELDFLYARIATPLIVTNFPALMWRIAQGELPHGAEIMTDIHARLLRSLHPFAFALPLSSSSHFFSCTPSASDGSSATMVTSDVNEIAKAK